MPIRPCPWHVRHAQALAAENEKLKGEVATLAVQMAGMKKQLEEVAAANNGGGSGSNQKKGCCCAVM